MNSEKKSRKRKSKLEGSLEVERVFISCTMNASIVLSVLLKATTSFDDISLRNHLCRYGAEFWLLRDTTNLDGL